MKASTKKVIPKRPGRPATGKDPLVSTRMPANLIAAVEVWAGRQDDNPGRSKAIRRLVELGLAGTRNSLPRPSEKNATKAMELAAEAIDRLVDPAAPAEERAGRKRRLLKGPEEFREVRADREKSKRK